MLEDAFCNCSNQTGRHSSTNCLRSETRPDSMHRLVGQSQLSTKERFAGLELAVSVKVGHGIIAFNAEDIEPNQVLMAAPVLKRYGTLAPRRFGLRADSEISGAPPVSDLPLWNDETPFQVRGSKTSQSDSKKPEARRSIPPAWG